ncbi:MAG: cohesin domain-containing protein [Acutalibacteraceae bacterium]|nr:cohesin domain-containing protein [Acutalibacteraceae bacterium]
MKKFKKILSMVLTVTIISTIMSIGIVNVNAASVVEDAISWAIAIANDNSHGYSQSSRWGPDYDCSSLVISAFRAAGCDTGNATYTGNMRSQFTAHGFQWIPWSQIGGTGNLQRGDILLNEKTHTEIYLGNNQNVGAHSNRGYPQTGDQTGTEVSVSGYYYHPWDGVLRYAGGPTPCTCSEDYAGDYIVNTNSQPLTMRSGHGTGYGIVTSIPKGSQVYVSKSDGNWAHVEWNGYNGYCSMSYLKKIENKNYRLHVWFSDTGMGGVPSNFRTGNRYYLCYELIDESTGKRANETSNMSYSATEKIKNSNGTIFEHTYNNSDNNWISFVCDTEDTYSGTVTISGDVGVSCSVSFTAWANTAPQIKTWAWEGDDSNEIESLSPGKTVCLSYLIRDKNTQKNLNDVTTYWTQGNGYTVTIEIYSPSGSLLKSQSFKNNDCVWIEFQPSSLGNYKMITKVSGNLSGTQEKTFTSVEKEHVYGIWQTTKTATCTTSGAKERQCIFCGHKETQTIQATGHDYGSWITTKSATCIATGTKTRTCSKCSKQETQSISATGHSYGSWTTTKSATCTSTGTKTRICSNCSNKETQTIAATGHKYITTVVAPTTTSKGYTLHKCSVCGDSYKDNYTDQLKPTDPNAPQIVVDNKTTSPGGQVTINVIMKNNPGINGWAVNVSYDSSVLELVKCDNGVYSDITTSNVITKNPYHIQWFNLGDVKTNGNLFTLTFNVKQNAKEGVYPIKLTYDEDEICNQKEERVHFDIVDGSLKVSKYIPGDINNDGKVNLRDVIRLNQYVAGWDVTVSPDTTDVNGDGKTNLRDVIRLNQYVAGWDVSIQ